MANEVLVPLDGSALADSAVAHAAEIARLVDGSLHLVRVHVPLRMLAVPSESPVLVPDPVLDERIRAESSAWLERRARAVSELNDLPVTWELRVGLAEAEVVLASAGRRSRLIVSTTRGSGGAATRWLGSVADSIIRHAWCPVLAMSPKAACRDVRIRKILVLLDGSEASGAIIPHAGWLANAFGAEIDYLRLTPEPESASKAILGYVAKTEPDAVALSTHGRGFLRLFLGGIADEVVRKCERPTLVFRPQGLAWSKLEPGSAMRRGFTPSRVSAG